MYDLERQNTILLPIGEYKELVSKAERIETLKRLYEANRYIGTGDILAVLGIEVAKEQGENGTV